MKTEITIPKYDDWAAWFDRIQEGNRAFCKKTGVVKLAWFELTCRLLSCSRVLRKAMTGALSEQNAGLQSPWLPRYLGLSATPLHDQQNYKWTELLRESCGEITKELMHVSAGFNRAHYDSDLNEKPWSTYYFYLHGRAQKAHLDACPKTRDVLAQIPHNGLHVCFSAIEPGGSLHPHTGPTNASLTAHLGLLNCTGTTLRVAGKEAPYRDNEVLLFDDSFVHWVENKGQAIRYTLMITFWHPELNYFERKLLHQVIKFSQK